MTALTNHLVLCMLIVFGIILVIYIIGSLIAGKSVMNSVKLIRGAETKAEMVYYLPTATLQLAATAKVVVATDVNQKIVSATLADLSFDNTVSFVADTEFAFGLNYKPSPFLADEVKFTVGPAGMLDSINTTTEDRLSNLISEIGALPAALNPKLVSIEEPSAEAPVISNTTTVTHCKNFYLPLWDIVGQKIFTWIINADGDTNGVVTTDASFTVDFSPLLNGQFQVSAQTVYTGVLTRPLQTVTITVSSAGASVNPPLRNTYALKIPDRNSLINVPVERSAFVKRVNTPKFSSGLLLENYINKPSQFEGFASIPINIGKALFSIPAQLFTFTVKKHNLPDAKVTPPKTEDKNNSTINHL